MDNSVTLIYLFFDFKEYKIVTKNEIVLHDKIT